MLTKIDTKDLIFSGNIEDDRTNTFLQLDDYDWMSYKLTTRFKTKELGVLYIDFSYFGMVTSLMEVTQVKDNITKEYEFEYSTDIFQKHITNFLTAHIAAWNDTYAFNGEDFVVAFYNEVIEKGNLKAERIPNIELASETPTEVEGQTSLYFDD